MDMNELSDELEGRIKKATILTEGVIQLDVVKQSLVFLTERYIIAQDAAADYKNVVDAVAEKSNIDASVIKTFIAAKHKDKCRVKKHLADQLSLLFEELP